MESRKILGIAIASGLVLGLALGSANRPVMSMAANRPWQHAAPGRHPPPPDDQAIGQQFGAPLPSTWNYSGATQPAFAEMPMRLEGDPMRASTQASRDDRSEKVVWGDFFEQPRGLNSSRQISDRTRELESDEAGQDDGGAIMADRLVQPSVQGRAQDE